MLYDAKLLDPIHHFLACKTRQAWIDKASQPENLAIILCNHLLCELKAAQSASYCCENMPLMNRAVIHSYNGYNLSKILLIRKLAILIHLKEKISCPNRSKERKTQAIANL